MRDHRTHCGLLVLALQVPVQVCKVHCAPGTWCVPCRKLIAARALWKFVITRATPLQLKR